MTKFGRLNNTHPHSWSFLDQPLVNGKFFGGESSRGLGGELSWLSPLPWFVELIGSATMAAGECCARSFYGGQDPGVEGIDDLLYTTALKQFFPLGSEVSLLWGLSGQFGPNPTGLGNRTEIYGTDIFLRWRPVDSMNRMAVSLQAELMLRRRQIPRDASFVALVKIFRKNLYVKKKLGIFGARRNGAIRRSWNPIYWGRCVGGGSARARCGRVGRR